LSCCPSPLFCRVVVPLVSVLPPVAVIVPHVAVLPLAVVVSPVAAVVLRRRVTRRSPITVVVLPVALLTLTVVVSPIAVIMSSIAVLPLAVVPPITVVDCVACRVSKKYLYRKKVILGTQLLQTDRRQRPKDDKEKY